MPAIAYHRSFTVSVRRIAVADWRRRTEGGLLRGAPEMRQQGAEVVGRELPGVAEHGEADQQVAQVGPGLDLVPAAGGDQAEQDRRGPAAVVGAAEEPVLSADGHAAQGVLAGVVVDV